MERASNTLMARIRRLIAFANPTRRHLATYSAVEPRQRVFYRFTAYLLVWVALGLYGISYGISLSLLCCMDLFESSLLFISKHCLPQPSSLGDGGSHEQPEEEENIQKRKRVIPMTRRFARRIVGDRVLEMMSDEACDFLCCWMAVLRLLLFAAAIDGRMLYWAYFLKNLLCRTVDDLRGFKFRLRFMNQIVDKFNRALYLIFKCPTPTSTGFFVVLVHVWCSACQYKLLFLADIIILRSLTEKGTYLIMRVMKEEDKKKMMEAGFKQLLQDFLYFEYLAVRKALVHSPDTLVSMAVILVGKIFSQFTGNPTYLYMVSLACATERLVLYFSERLKQSQKTWADASAKVDPVVPAAAAAASVDSTVQVEDTMESRVLRFAEKIVTSNLAEILKTTQELCLRVCGGDRWEEGRVHGGNRHLKATLVFDPLHLSEKTCKIEKEMGNDVACPVEVRGSSAQGAETSAAADEGLAGIEKAADEGVTAAVVAGMEVAANERVAAPAVAEMEDEWLML